MLRTFNFIVKLNETIFSVLKRKFNVISYSNKHKLIKMKLFHLIYLIRQKSRVGWLVCFGLFSIHGHSFRPIIAKIGV